MKYIIILIIIFSFGFFNPCFAQTSASQTERMQEITEKEEALRNKLEKEDKFFIKKIIVQGSKLLLEEEIEYLISPFQKHWLTKQNIQQLLNIIKEAYKQKGAGQPVGISYQIKKKNLIIKVEE